MELLYAIADELGVPNEFVFVDRVVGNIAWFHLKSGASFSCHTVRKGKFMRKHSIRREDSAIDFGHETSHSCPHGKQPGEYCASCNGPYVDHETGTKFNR